MIDFIVAYANDSTEYEWQMIGVHPGDFQSAINHIHAILPDMPNSALAIFARKDGDRVHWSDKRPRRIYNRSVLTKDLPIPAVLGGLINSRESDWF